MPYHTYSNQNAFESTGDSNRYCGRSGSNAKKSKQTVFFCFFAPLPLSFVSCSALRNNAAKVLRQLVTLIPHGVAEWTSSCVMLLVDNALGMCLSSTFLHDSEF